MSYALTPRLTLPLGCHRPLPYDVAQSHYGHRRAGGGGAGEDGHGHETNPGPAKNERCATGGLSVFCPCCAVCVCALTSLDSTPPILQSGQCSMLQGVPLSPAFPLAYDAPPFDSTTLLALHVVDMGEWRGAGSPCLVLMSRGCVCCACCSAASPRAQLPIHRPADKCQVRSITHGVPQRGTSSRLP